MVIICWWQMFSKALCEHKRTVWFSISRACVAFLLLLQGILLAYADAPRQLAWGDLIPKAVHLDNPLAKYTKSQLLSLSDIANTRDRKERGDKISAIDQADEDAAVARLKKENVDVDNLLSRRKEFMANKRARAQAANMELAGKLVRMPGYLLPLEYDGRQVAEFLLVPWVGACVHTPPPPPNQIVYVNLETPIDFPGMFTPVQVSGQMTVTETKKALYLIDGSSDISIGYSISAARVEPYKE